MNDGRAPPSHLFIMYLNGIDLSSWQGGADALGNNLFKTLDWSLYAEAGWHYAFIRVSNGLILDKLFPLQWGAARGHIYRSWYHYFNPVDDVTAALDKCLVQVGEDESELPPVLDLETSGGLNGDMVADRALTWLDRCETKTGKRPILYSGFYFLRDVIVVAAYPEFTNYDLWMASYPYDNYPEPARTEKIYRVMTGQDSHTFPIPPFPFTDELIFNQWTSKGSALKIPGCYTGIGYAKNYDINFYKGTLASLKARYNLGDLPEIGEPPTMSDYYEYTASGGDRRIRAAPGANNSAIAGANTIYNGKKAKGGAISDDEYKLVATDSAVIKGIGKVGDIWVKIFENNGVAVTGWTAYTHMGVMQFQQRVLIPGTTPPPTTPPAFPSSIEKTETLKYPDGSQATYKGTLTKQ